MKGVIYIKILNKSKYNIFSIFSCLILVFAFVFGCVQYVFASETKNALYFLQKANAFYDAYLCVVTNYEGAEYYQIFTYNSLDCGAYVRENNGQLSFGLLSKSRGLAYNISVSMNDEQLYVSSYDYNNCSVQQYYGYDTSTHNEFIRFESNACVFSNYGDLYNYLDTGEVNNPIYQPIQEVEYDISVEIPLMAQCQVNGHDYLFNCKQSVPHDDYKLQVAVDLRLTPIYGNFASKQYSDKEQIFRSGKTELGSYDNKGTIFNTSFSTDDLLKGIDTDRKSLGFKEFYQGYNILLPYKEPVLSEVIFYARNVSGNKCSNWVRVTFDLITETSKYEEVESVSGSNIPSDTKTSNSEYYPEDYVYNDNEAYGGGFNASSTLNSLEHNYTQLVLFYKDLFSFLPSEIWALLIGLVSAMVVIALFKFIRG